MARKCRIDYQGALHHVMARGVARSDIFRCAEDRSMFLDCMAPLLKSAGAACYAWCLMSNHFHLLLRTGHAPLENMMRKLLTRYAVRFNLKYDRSGHLFQNRYKSVICEEDRYFKVLVRYIHLNPLRAKLVGDFNDLDLYPWCGHGVLSGKQTADWQDTGLVLGLFSGSEKRARRDYVEYVSDGANEGRIPEYSGEKPHRLDVSPGRDPDKEEIPGHQGDTRILGSDAFVAGVMARVDAADRRRRRILRLLSPEEVIARAARLAGVPEREIRVKNNRPIAVIGRSLACKWLVEDLGVRGAEVAVLMGITPSAVTQNVARGRRIEAGKGFALAVGAKDI